MFFCCSLVTSELAWLWLQELRFEVWTPKILLLYTLGQPNEGKIMKGGWGRGQGVPQNTHNNNNHPHQTTTTQQQQQNTTKTHTNKQTKHTHTHTQKPLGSNTKWRGLATHFFVWDCVSGEIVWNVGTGESLWNLNGEILGCWHLWNKVCSRSLVLCSRCRTELRTARSLLWLKIVLTELCELIMAEDPPHRTMQAYHGRRSSSQNYGSLSWLKIVLTEQCSK